MAKRVKILVVGDLMLDHYIWGSCDRISPEAPVQVVKINNETYTLGGAGNVVRNLLSLGANVSVASVLGDDEAGKKIKEKLAELNVKDELILTEKGRESSIKSRIMASHQQVVRIDKESVVKINLEDELVLKVKENLANFKAVLLSDYGKGVLNEVAAMIAAARAAGKPVLIDPKGADFSKYAGATLLTPNRAELRDAAGGWENEAGLTAKAQGLRETLGLDALLVTRSEEGMTLYRADGQTHQPTRAQEVYDVSGAGDTVIAAMGLSLAAGYTLPEAMHTANAAASIVVAKLGTAVCSFNELVHELAT